MQPDQTPNVSPLTNPEVAAQPEQVPVPSVPELQPAPPAAPPAAPPIPPPAAPVVVPLIIPQPAAPPPPTPPVPAGGFPATADDVDVIEKEWVDQADRIIAKTKNDPYIEEETVENLQIDYLKKRYGHDVKKTESS